MAKTSTRGRRGEKKAAARERLVDEDESSDETPEVQEEKNPEVKPVFYGLVDANEIDYFKQAESTLNINAFEGDEDRIGFILSVLEEAKGKELKLVTNQICSKLMERLVLYGDDKQVKSLFKAFENHFVPLAHHKYSSHVLETLLVRSAALIEKESIEETEQVDDDILMEQLFVLMLSEFKPHIKSIIDHQYASHTLRLLILILSAKELPSTTVSNSTLRSKKSKIARKMIEIKDTSDFNRAFQVPPSFKDELKDLLQSLVAGQDMKKMRELAIHKVASPVLQLAIQVEGMVDKERSVWHLLFSSENSDKDSQEEAFVEYLLSDPVGSHFLENVIKNEGPRIKYLDRLYKLYMKDRVLKLAKRASTGVYIIQALLFKLKPVEVEFILDQIIPELAGLISVSENQNLDLGRSVIDASISRGNYRRDEIIEQLFAKFAPNFNINRPALDTTTEFFENTLQLTGSTLGNARDDWPTAEERRRSLFVEKLMEYDYSFVVCVWLNFLALPSEKFTQMCFHGVFSHIVEDCMVVQPEKETRDINILRKRFLNIFQGQIVKLACNSYGSHIVDKLWNFTVLLPMYKDRIATELVQEPKTVKDSIYGKLVWKNWNLELFLRKKYDWKALVKTQENEYYGAERDQRTKRPIDLKLEQLKKEKESRDHKRPSEFTDDKKVKMRGRRR